MTQSVEGGISTQSVGMIDLGAARFKKDTDGVKAPQRVEQDAGFIQQELANHGALANSSI
nr:hypothetical protein [Pseudomonas tolaasii]